MVIVDLGPGRIDSAEGWHLRLVFYISDVFEEKPLAFSEYLMLARGLDLVLFTVEMMKHYDSGVARMLNWSRCATTREIMA